jgi:hypothetical protein
VGRDPAERTGIVLICAWCEGRVTDELQNEKPGRVARGPGFETELLGSKFPLQ